MDGNSSRLEFESILRAGQSSKKEADEILKQCVPKADDPNASAGTLFNAGMAEQYLGDVARARKDFKQSLIADPRYWRARIAINAE